MREQELGGQTSVHGTMAMVSSDENIESPFSFPFSWRLCFRDHTKKIEKEHLLYFTRTIAKNDGNDEGNA